jgi:electron transfer flavoprotein alpha subunit
VGSLVVAEQLNGQLRDVTFELIAAARDFGPTTVALIGSNPWRLADAVAVEGVSEILLVDVGTDDFVDGLHRTVLAELISRWRPSLILLASTSNSLSFAAAVATTSELGFASDVHGLRAEDGAVVAARSFYGGKVDAEIDFPGRDGVLLLLRPGVWPAAGGQGEVVRTDVLVTKKSGTEQLELIVPPSSGEVDLARADLILAVGRGIGERENLDLFESLAAKMGATLAASRPLVDAGWVPAERQVGQSGKTVKPRVYLAFGISGASQHLAGMQASETIVAVNHDPNAAIFTIADFAGVFDTIALAQELEKLY